MKKKIVLICTLFLCVSVFANKEGKWLVLENEYIEAVFYTKNGALVRMTDKNSGWEIMRREILGQSFELLLPLEGVQMSDADCRYNVIKGVEQAKPLIEQSNGKITFVWSGVKSELMDKPADIIFKGEVRLLDKGLEFSGSLINNSEYTVEYVSWPCIGEVTVPDKTQPLYQSTRNDIKGLFPRFSNRGAYWGIDYPTSTYIFPEKSFLQVNNSKEGFMIYNRTLSKHTIITSFELIPGFDKRNTNPYEDEMDGQLVRIQFKANHVLYSKVGDVAVLDSLKLVTYSGAWTEGLKLYRDDCMAYTEKMLSSSAHWLAEPLTWRKVGIKRAADLLRYANESVKFGVKVLLVKGWYKWENARPVEIPNMDEAILECQKLGMRVILETNWLNVDRYAAGYKDRQRKYMMSDPFGMPYNYGYMCPNAPEVRRCLQDMWLSLPALRIADGYMNNDHNHSGKTYMCFDQNHGHRFGEPTINGMMELDRIMAEALTQNGTKVAMGQGFIDFQNSIYDGYLIGVSDNFYDRHRYLDPKEPILTRVEVKNARRGMNKALLYRMNIVYDLYFHSDSLSDYPNIMEYGNQMGKLRNRYLNYIWNATFDGHNGMKVDGKNIEYSIYVNKAGKRTAVVCNMSNESVTQVSVSCEGVGELRYATPETLEDHSFEGIIELAPLSAIIIMEQ